ncbi:MAG: ATP phosphoribosyltransferase regulatory subunit [Spirochaetaceae bacterium]
MTAQRRNILRLPQGTESFHLGEALRHRRRLRRLEDLYASWGYLPVETPIFDFYDVYAPLMQAKTAGEVYRLIDREGELLMLRSDATLFMAKQLGLILQDEDLPVRVYYADTILRHQEPDDIAKNEFVQTGVELIGEAGIQAEAEVLLLLWETLAEAGATDAVIHLGSRRIINAVTAHMSDRAAEELRTAVTLRDAGSIRGALAAGTPKGTPGEAASGAALSGGAGEAALRLLSFIGTASELEELRTEMPEILGEEVAAALDHLSNLSAELSPIIPAERLRIDLSEVGGQPYYTGIVFRAYIPDTDSEIASGGRYDELLGRYGFNAPSVGFSLLPGKVESAQSRLRAAERLPEPAQARGTTLQERYEDARRRRAAGETVRL